MQKNFDAIDEALKNLQKIELPEQADEENKIRDKVLEDRAPKFVKEVTMEMMKGRGDLIPVSALPPDGTYPTGTTQFDKTNLAQTIPIWEPDVCIQCGICTSTCPENAIALVPQLDLSAEAYCQKVIHEEEPYPCIECGKLFGVKSTIEHIVEKLESNNATFTHSDNIRLICMCGTCRDKHLYQQ